MHCTTSAAQKASWIRPSSGAGGDSVCKTSGCTEELDGITLATHTTDGAHATISMPPLGHLSCAKSVPTPDTVMWMEFEVALYFRLTELGS